MGKLFIKVEKSKRALNSSSALLCDHIIYYFMSAIALKSEMYLFSHLVRSIFSHILNCNRKLPHFFIFSLCVSWNWHLKSFVADFMIQYIWGFLSHLFFKINIQSKFKFVTQCLHFSRTFIWKKHCVKNVFHTKRVLKFEFSDVRKDELGNENAILPDTDGKY